MSTQLSPIVSELETQEQADSYDRWFRAKVQASLDDPRPSIPHDQVMAEMRALIEFKAQQARCWLSGGLKRGPNSGKF
ncbi:hypothetical protein D3C76_1234990 [compost metagenome]